MGTVPTRVILNPSQVILSVTVILATETDSSYFEWQAIEKLLKILRYKLAG